MIELHIVLGSMFSSKTTYLLNKLSSYKAVGLKTVFINHSFDTRCDENKTKTHSGLIRNCIKTNKLMSVVTNPVFKDADVIAIDEAQFFNSLYSFICHIEKCNKIVYIGGLDGCYKREPFGEILKIIPLSNTITKLHSLCKECKDGTPGIFTKKMNENKKKIDIGADDKYIAVCRKCYFK